MRTISFGTSRPARFVGPAACLAIILGLVAAFLLPHDATASAAPLDDHQQAVAALTDVKVALAQLVRADASYKADPDVYHNAAQRAINALGGESGSGYVAAVGNPGDAAGALGHIDALLDRKATLVWTSPLEGAEANIRAAVIHLHDAVKADELLEYALAASRAIAFLEVARGRSTQSGVFGGLEGALANTVLGVPAGARQTDACAAPTAAPSYGTHGGYVAWIAMPASSGTHVLAENPGGTSMSVQDGMIVLRTAVAKQVADACNRHAQADPPAARAADPPATQPPQSASVPPPGGKLPALYTTAQAEEGKQIFATKCVACHGTNLQGTAAPSVAGTDFLTTAQHDGWTVGIIRYIVFEQMPRNAPSTLPPNDSADLMAFLLASDCYPAGTKPFPATDDPALAKIKLGPVPGHPAGQNAKGVCDVK